MSHPQKVIAGFEGLSAGTISAYHYSTMPKHLVVMAIVLSTLAISETSFVGAMNEQQMVQLGKDSFQRRCSGCHGVTGEGNGPGAVMLNPRPRNLVTGSFKFRTTPSGSLPTISDLLRTLNVGVVGTAMPSFRDLPESEKMALVLYLRSLRPEFKETLADQVPTDIPQTPRDIFGTKAGLLAAAKKGKTHFRTACVSCHGDLGDGNGPAAPDLTDSDNIPILPANLRRPYIKGGKTPRDVFRAISTGLDGSPMPGFESLFSAQQRWEIVAYVYYLRGLESGIYSPEKDKI